ncbi:SpoIIE family protein phosphatase [Kineococcus sp. SYSU DK003]|uniref:SpoIIE family protein phosphatase n=1 Tax=Kineococcus sp. SYSU DK003 TaxID=3383124 RepID=UPI003D7E857E
MDSPAAAFPLEHLQRTAADLAAALDVRDAVTAVVRTGRDVLHTNTCGIALLDETGTVLVPQEPHEDLAGLGLGRAVPLTSGTPSAEAARTRRPVLLPDRAALAERFGRGPGLGLNDSVLALGEHSWAMYPLLARDRLVGVLRFGFLREGSLDADEQVFAATLADQCALAVERARLLHDARRSERRYRTLASAGSLDLFTARPGEGIVTDLPGWAALTGRDVEALRGHGWRADVHPDDLPVVLATSAESVSSGVAARFRFRLRTPGGWRTIAAVSVPVPADPTDPDSEVLEWVGSFDDITDRARAAARARSLQALTAALATATTYPQVLDAVLHASLDGPGAVRGTLAVVEGPGELRVHRMLGDRTRRSTDLPDVTLDDLTALAGERGAFPAGRAGVAALPERIRPYFEAAAAAGEEAWAVLPLASRTRRLGTLTLGFAEAEAHEEEEREFLLSFARQVAAALERMQLLQQQRDTADVLAEALRPGPLPPVQWLATHRVATTSAGVEVGGDWAELIPLPGPGGVVSRVAVVLGDVMGRGARAATVMGEVRTQVRTLALIDPHPTAVLRGLDACARAGGADDLVTIFYGVLDRDGRLLAASAGHLPPLTCSGGPHYLDVPPGVPVGVDGDCRTDVLDVRLAPGSGLVVFSDGLVETRSRSLTQGLEEVLEHFGTVAGGGPAEIVGTLVERMVGEGTGTAVDDDVTVLALQLG